MRALLRTSVCAELWAELLPEGPDFSVARIAAASPWPPEMPASQLRPRALFTLLVDNVARRTARFAAQRRRCDTA